MDPPAPSTTRPDEKELVTRADASLAKADRGSSFTGGPLGWRHPMHVRHL